MVSATTGTEYLLATKVAEEYRSKGYEVARDVALDFLPGFYADLIARKDDEVRVIEVKSRSSLAANPQIGEMARLVDEKRGWTFELRLVGEPHRSNGPNDGQPSQLADVDERIDEAKRGARCGASGSRAYARVVGCGGFGEKGGLLPRELPTSEWLPAAMHSIRPSFWESSPGTTTAASSKCEANATPWPTGSMCPPLMRRLSPTSLTWPAKSKGRPTTPPVEACATTRTLAPWA